MEYTYYRTNGKMTGNFIIRPILAQGLANPVLSARVMLYGNITGKQGRKRARHLE